MSVFSRFPTEQLIFHKRAGGTFEVIGLVGDGVIGTEDTSIPIELDDWFERSLPSGLKEYYIVTDPGFINGKGSINSHYQTKVKMLKMNPKICNPSKQKLIFISHSTNDKEYVKAFVDFLFSIGFNEDDIVCSSYPGLGIPLRGKIYDWLVEKFQEYDLHVLFFLSKNYYNSVASLNEMGAAWAMKQKWDAVLLPGFSFDMISGCIDPRQISISFDMDKDELNHYLGELKDGFVTEFELRTISETRWEKIRNELVEKIKKVVPDVNNSSEDDIAITYHSPVSRRDRYSLSVYACVMLMYAAADNGEILIASDLQGDSYQAGKTVMERSREPRELALWDGAVGQLLAKGYIKQKDIVGRRFIVTDNGYYLEEAFRTDNGLDVGKTPAEVLKVLGDRI